MRIVFDTSVLIAALSKPRGAAGRIVRAWRDGAIEAVVSAATLREIEGVVGARWVERIAPREDVADLLRDLHERTVRVRPRRIRDLSLKDEGDLRMVEAAVSGGASFLVTADREVLRARGYGGVEFVTAAQLSARFAHEP